MTSSNYELGIVIKNVKKDNPKIAIIQIGNLNTDAFGETGDIYSYPETITETELLTNINLDKQFYDRVILQLPLPQHIRLKELEAAYE
jgi:5,10-methylene-tetrahydrofolate dehydrogenase/methenyl tetrahydrofolate cyclohydrolase